MRSYLRGFALFSMFVMSQPAYSQGFFSGFFEPSFSQTHKDACIDALRNELAYQSDYQGIGTNSGFLRPDVFEASFVSSDERDGGFIYFFNLRVEGIWHLAIEDDPFNRNRYLQSKRIVDAYRVVSLGVLSSDQAEPDSFLEIYDRQHIEFRGKAYCRFYSEDSKTPNSQYVQPGAW
ncbi:hypothetical protein [Aliiroseovarius sp. S1123]|uniref:hypothetical protein n=1 Tax=Aliiroseovarius sp. S1123 TaxID=2926404 RepID=UPI001FF2EF26|nr:hypothetical protein [Aliiroseovarius sp. S1123]